MKRKFTEEDNRIIYEAYNSLRALMTVSAAVDGMTDPHSGAANITTKTGNGSVIYSLVKGKDWNQLFLNAEWLNILEAAMNLNYLQNDCYKNYLLTIAKFFPIETKSHIIVDLL